MFNYLADQSIPLNLRMAMADTAMRIANAEIACMVGPYQYGDTVYGLGVALFKEQEELRLGAALIAARAWE